MKKIREDWSAKILEGITAQIASGKISGEPEEVFTRMLNAESRNFPFMNEAGLARFVATKLGISLEDDADNSNAPETFYKIKDLPSLVGEGGPENICIKGKIMHSRIDSFDKSDGSGKWIIAKIDLADETAWTDTAVFYDERYGSIFHKIEAEELDGITLILKNIKVDVSKFSPYPVSVSIRKYGKFEISQEDIEAVKERPEPVLISSTKKGKNALMLLKVIKGKKGIDFKIKKDGTKFCTFTAVDVEGKYITVNLWKCTEFTKNFMIKEDDIILAQGKIDENDYQGKTYKKLGINDDNDVKINPAGYAFESKGTTAVEKNLINAELGDVILATVFIDKLFKKDKLYYLACPITNEKDRECGKGVSQDNDSGIWKCNGGHVLEEDDVKKVKKVGMIAGSVSNEEVKLNFNIFDRSGELVKKLAGKDIDALVKEVESKGAERVFNRINDKVKKTPFQIKARVTEDNRGTIALNIEEIDKVDLVADSERLKSCIKTVVS